MSEGEGQATLPWWLLEGWLPAGAVLERLEMSPWEPVLVAAGSAKSGGERLPSPPASHSCPTPGLPLAP